jgi:hypothetical protein
MYDATSAKKDSEMRRGRADRKTLSYHVHVRDNVLKFQRSLAASDSAPNALRQRNEHDLDHTHRKCCRGKEHNHLNAAK